MATATEPPVSMGASSDTPYLLTIDAFARMVEEGFFPEGRRVYLRDGGLYEKMAKSKAHGGVGGAITMAIARRLPEDWAVWPESTVALDRLNGPLPDLVVVRGGDPLKFVREDRYPEPRDIGLLIEIAWTSLAKDLEYRERYARAMIPVYWIVDLQGRRLLAFSGPRVVDGRGEYEREAVHAAGEEIPLVLDGVEVARIPAAEILP